jgi:ribosomal protein L36
VKVSVARCKPIGLMQVVRREGNVVVSAALEKYPP